MRISSELTTFFANGMKSEKYGEEYATAFHDIVVNDQIEGDSYQFLIDQIHQAMSEVSYEVTVVIENMFIDQIEHWISRLNTWHKILTEVRAIPMYSAPERA